MDDCGGRAALGTTALWVRVRNGRLHPLHRGVYAVGHANPPLEGRWLAAVKACGPGARLSHFSAAALWGFVPWDDRFPEVTIEGPAPRSHRGIRIHRTPPSTATTSTEPPRLPVTAPARTLVDLASVLPYAALRRAVRQAQALRHTSTAHLLAARARLGPRRGAARLARIIATGPAPTRSELEDVVLDLLLRGGLEHPDVNVPLTPRGRRVDSRTSAGPRSGSSSRPTAPRGTTTPTAREDDAERQALLEAHGERVLRVTLAPAVVRPGETLHRVRAAGAPGWATYTAGRT